MLPIYRKAATLVLCAALVAGSAVVLSAETPRQAYTRMLGRERTLRLAANPPTLPHDVPALENSPQPVRPNRPSRVKDAGVKGAAAVKDAARAAPGPRPDLRLDGAAASRVSGIAVFRFRQARRTTSPAATTRITCKRVC